MLRRMMKAILNKDVLDDKDYLGNKRFELVGHPLSLLFEELFNRMNYEARKIMDTLLAKDKGANVKFEISKFISKNIITMGLERALSTGNFDVKGFKMRGKGVTQVVSRLSYIGLLGQMTKISAEFLKSREAREVQTSQWGLLCPSDTPVGEACGLAKNLALITHVTTDEDEAPIISLCYTMGVEDLEQLSAEEVHTKSSYLIMLNWLILGKHRFPQKFADSMRKLRRAGKIGEFVNIFVNKKQGCVYIASDGGRLCHPLVIADNGVSKIKEHHMKELTVGVRDFDSFLTDGLIEYLNVSEENNSLIALYEKDTTPETTHIEIDPSTILGVCAGLIPYPHHNQSALNTYQVGYDKLGAGQNATVAVMSFSGYDINGAIVMNKSSLDRGFGRSVVMKRYSAITQKYEIGTSGGIIGPEGDGAEHMQVLLGIQMSPHSRSHSSALIQNSLLQSALWCP